MKKLLYIFLFSLVVAFTVTSCTEDNVKPADTGHPNGGGGSN